MPPAQQSTRQSDGQRAAPTAETPATGQTDGKASQFEAKTERELQRTVENWLTGRGYRRLTAENLAGAGSFDIWFAGWFGHWPSAKRNPIMPDILILDAGMSCALCIELKVGQKPAYQPGQRESIEAGRWVECRTLDAVMVAVAAWEAGI